jgi:transposase
MKRFIEGADRGQSTLLPECLDDWVDEGNPVRAVDAFVDALNLKNSVLMASFRRRRAALLTIRRVS